MAGSIILAIPLRFYQCILIISILKDLKISDLDYYIYFAGFLMGLLAKVSAMKAGEQFISGPDGAKGKFFCLYCTSLFPSPFCAGLQHLLFEISLYRPPTQKSNNLI